MAMKPVSKKLNEKQKEILARKLGYDGPMNMFEQFVKSDAAMGAKYNAVISKYMARGGAVKKFAEGGVVGHFTNLADDFQAKANDMSLPVEYRQAMQLNADIYKNLSQEEAVKAGQTPPTFSVEKVETGPELGTGQKATVQQYQGLIESAKQRGNLNLANVYQQEIERTYAQAGMQSPAVAQASGSAAPYEAPSAYTPSASEQNLTINEAKNLAADAIRENGNTKANEIFNARSRNEITQDQYASLMDDLEKQTTAAYATLNKTAETNNPINVLAFVDDIRTQISTPVALPSPPEPAETPTTPAVPPTTVSTPPTTVPTPPTTDTGTTTPPTTDTGTTTPTTTPTTPGTTAPGVTAPTATTPTSLSASGVQVPQVTAATVPTTTEQMASAIGAPTTAAQITPTTATQVSQAPTQAPKQAATAGAVTATPTVQAALQGVQPATGTVSEQALVTPATMTPTETEVGKLQAATGEATMVQAPAPRTVQAGELISGPAVDMGRVEETLSQAQAAQGVVTDEMTVAGQIQKLTADFDATNPPTWAAGAIRNVNAELVRRGIGVSSMAGQAILQTALESALPIAAADAQTFKEMGIQNLANRQQMAVLTAQQRAAFLGQEFDQAFQTRVTNAATISEIANINFTAEQQIALENARLTNTVNLANLSNQQALIMAEAAQIANLEMANLNNRQQAQVLNAQAFLQMDMANLSNEQQTELFKAQSMVNSILSDSAAENAARQFNASSINQVNQFYDGLTAQINQFNVAQSNGMEQFNVSQINAVAEFNAQVQNARDQFNAEFRRIIDQSNVEWRRNIALVDTAATNRANEINATNAMSITTIEYNNMWQQYRDQLEMAWKTGESALDRETQLAMQVLAKQAQIESAKYAVEVAKYEALGQLAATTLDKTGAAADLYSMLKKGGSSALSTIQNIFGSSDTPFELIGDYTSDVYANDPAYGWQFFGDGTQNVAIDPEGSYWAQDPSSGNYSMIWSDPATLDDQGFFVGVE